MRDHAVQQIAHCTHTISQVWGQAPADVQSHLNGQQDGHEAADEDGCKHALIEKEPTECTLNIPRYSEYDLHDDDLLATWYELSN